VTGDAFLLLSFLRSYNLPYISSLTHSLIDFFTPLTVFLTISSNLPPLLHLFFHYFFILSVVRKQDGILSDIKELRNLFNEKVPKPIMIKKSLINDNRPLQVRLIIQTDPSNYLVMFFNFKMRTYSSRYFNYLSNCYSISYFLSFFCFVFLSLFLISDFSFFFFLFLFLFLIFLLFPLLTFSNFSLVSFFFLYYIKRSLSPSFYLSRCILLPSLPLSPVRYPMHSLAL
jgi:hypothetical protein